MSRLTRDGTAEPVSRDQIRRVRGHGDIYFPCSADHEQDWQPYPVDPYSTICDDHTYIHTYIHRCDNLILRGLNPECTRDWMLRQPLRDVGIEHVGFRVQQRNEESHPPLANQPFVAQQSSFLVTYAL